MLPERAVGVGKRGASSVAVGFEGRGVTFDWSNPPYNDIFQARVEAMRRLRSRPEALPALRQYYRANPRAWINDFGVTYDPRNAGSTRPTLMPFVTFPRQDDLITFLYGCLAGNTSGLIEKCRDMGATWISAAVSWHLWLFEPGVAIGWGSRKEQLVDKLGDPDSIFEKIRILIRYTPPEFLPAGFSDKEHMPFMRIINPENGSTITGEAGDNIGRGGRKRIFFKDESSHYERPELIEAALGENTNVQIDISSVNGTGNVFHRNRENGVVWEPGQPMAKGRANVLIMDWRHHPLKDQAWYDRKRSEYEAKGILHKFAQEIDRDYSSAVEGVIIPARYVTAAIDAHLKLGWERGGRRVAGLDVADGGGDLNALADRMGPMLDSVDEWGAEDTGVTARRAVTALATGEPLALMYDCIGVGAGVKAELNRLAANGGVRDGITVAPWNAGSSPLRPKARIIPGDPQSPRNGDFYRNLKAQAWWELRNRFERTYRAVVEGHEYDLDDLIFLRSGMPRLEQLRKELSQATRDPHKDKLVVNKSPEGTRSPNMADAVVMAFWPVGGPQYSLDGW